MIFETYPPPQFWQIPPVTLVSTQPQERLAKAFQCSFEKQALLQPQERIAFELFSTSFFNHSPDTRLVLLVSAVETLVERKLRPPEVRCFVDLFKRLIEESSTIDPEDKRSLRGSLDDLCKESIGQAVRRMVEEKLSGRTYGGREAGAFFKQCYNLRSKLVHGVHGQDPRPSPKEIAEAVVNLEAFVGDLLSGPLLQQVTL